MALFQDKVGRKRPGNKEKRNYRSVPLRSYPTRNRKLQKIKKIPLWLHFKQKQVGKGRERAKIKIIVPFRYNPTRNRKFKKLKNSVMALFQAKVGRKRLGKRENRNYRSVPFLPDV